MSSRQNLQSGSGELEYWGPAFGMGKIVSVVGPTNAQIGYAVGCEWVNATTGQRYLNVGTFSSSIWLEQDLFPDSASSIFGGGLAPSSTQATMKGSGNLYRTVLTTANKITPSATAALKIVDEYTLPALSFDALGRGIQFSIYCNNTGTSGHTVQIQVVANPTNTGFGASSWPTVTSGNQNVTSKTDGSVTVTGGTVILDTGTSYAPTGTVTFSMQLTGQLFKTGAKASNTQESIVTGIFPSAGLTHTAAWTDQTLTEANAQVFVVCILAATTAADIVYQGMEITAFN